MQNSTRVCVRYESEIYGAALVKAIKEKVSKWLLLLILVIIILIGYLIVSNDSEEEISEEETETQRKICSDETQSKDGSEHLKKDGQNELAEKFSGFPVVDWPPYVEDVPSNTSNQEKKISPLADTYADSLTGNDVRKNEDQFVEENSSKDRYLKEAFAQSTPIIESEACLLQDDNHKSRQYTNIRQPRLDIEEVSVKRNFFPLWQHVDSVEEATLTGIDAKPLKDNTVAEEIEHYTQSPDKLEEECLIKSTKEIDVEIPSDKVFKLNEFNQREGWDDTCQLNAEQPIIRPQLREISDRVVDRDSISDKSDTTIRRKSTRWDSDDFVELLHEVKSNPPCSKPLRQDKIRHVHSSDEIEACKKTMSDTESRAASVEDDWRDTFFETLHSARSSISASSLSLLVASTSPEQLSDLSLHSLTEESEEKTQVNNTYRLHKTVKQLYAGRIEDRFDTLEDVTKAIEEAGLVHSRIIIGIDYTKSNMETGRKTFGGKCLHTIKPGIPNPYQEVIRILCKTLNKFDEDNMICAYGFGDSRTNDQHVFKLNPASLYCHGFEGVLDAYNLITPIIKLGGPTTFAPMIEEAIKIVESSRMYTILILIADGQLVDEKDTVDAIVKASNYPLSIVLVGVGDGPWDKMKEFDDALPQRKFDNFQFVNYHQVIKLSSLLPGNQSSDSLFALMALMEIPDQYMQINQLGYLDEQTGRYRIRE